MPVVNCIYHHWNESTPGPHLPWSHRNLPPMDKPSPRESSSWHHPCTADFIGKKLMHDEWGTKSKALPLCQVSAIICPTPFSGYQSQTVPAHLQQLLREMPTAKARLVIPTILLFSPQPQPIDQSQDELEPTQVPKASLAASPTPAHHALSAVLLLQELASACSQNPRPGACSYATSIPPLPPSHPFETNAKVNTWNHTHADTQLILKHLQASFL